MAPMWIEQVLSRLDGDDVGTVPGKIRAFQLILSLVICTEYWTKSLRRWSELQVDDGVALTVVTLLTAAVVHGRWRRAAFAGFACLQAWYVWSLFPQTGNHRYLELAFSALFALLDDEKAEEQRLLLRSLRWVVIVVLFYSGVQKLVHGYYFRGQFLAYSLWRDTFRPILGTLLPGEELQRLTSYGGIVGDGPYLVSSPLFLTVSNAVWVVEIALALLLFSRATRAYACAAACAFMIATESVARELMFGVEFVSAVLLFARSDLLRRLIWPIVGVLTLLWLVRLGLLPEVVFH
jgi:hypothetical protein